MTAADIAQWVINNRYPKTETDKVSDFEMYHEIIDKIQNNFISKSETLTKGLIQKGCYNCIYNHIDIALEPCIYCHNFSKHKANNTF